MINVLIVDDSKFMRETLRYFIEDSGHEVVGEAANAEDAVTLYKRLHPQVVTLDYLMEGQNGIEALKEIVQFDQTAKVIMVTAIERDDIKTLALKCGACSFINKPPNREELLREIERVIAEKPVESGS
ncbi:MAG: response regulator [Xanthomonadales bacterium]|nr:response regulator [Xanthomonadales bacterium]